MDEVLEVRFHINAQIDSMHVNEFKGFTVLYGPNTSNSMSFVNGIQKSNFMLSYGLRANKNGKIKIKSPTFFVEGKGLKGNVIKVKISKATKQGKKPEKKVVKGTHYS
ncbi:MAG: BatD family protein [Crocinitomicaceae bacterium]|nr:BatD family protein [Crocinitomicaceae bacterium]